MTIEPALACLLSALWKHIGVEPLAFEPDGVCALQIDNAFAIGLRPGRGDDELWLMADLGPPARGPDLYPLLLRSNLFWTATSGATASLTDDEPPHVAFAQPVSWRAEDANSLMRKLESFIGSVEEWREIVASASEDDIHRGQEIEAHAARRMWDPASRA